MKLKPHLLPQYSKLLLNPLFHRPLPLASSCAPYSGNTVSISCLAACHQPAANVLTAKLVRDQGKDLPLVEDAHQLLLVVKVSVEGWQVLLAHIHHPSSDDPPVHSLLQVHQPQLVVVPVKGLLGPDSSLCQPVLRQLTLHHLPQYAAVTTAAAANSCQA